METEQNLKALHAAFLENGIDCVQNESLAKHSTFCIGGPASLIAYPNSRRQLIRVLDLWRELGDNCPICVIGNGSGVLFSDHGYGDAANIRQCMESNMASRIAKQPIEYPSAGQVFKRPVDNFAGRMIEIIGLKGHSIGGAQISDKHAGFIVNRGGATAEDVMALIRVMQDEVEKKYGYRLESMIRFVTDDSDACHTPRKEGDMA